MSIETRLQRLEKASPAKPHKVAIVIYDGKRAGFPEDEVISRHIADHPGDADATLFVVIVLVG